MRILLKIVVILMVTLLLVELACRCIWSDQVSFWSSAYRPPISTQYLNLALFQETPHGRKLAPNLTMLASSPHSNERNFILRTNSFGFRGAEPLLNDMRPRVLFLGDSVTWNDYLAEEETFPVLLQKHLADNVQVFNGAIGSTGIDNYLMTLQHLGPKLKPNLVLVGLYLNDSIPSPAYKPPHAPFPLFFSRYLSLLIDQIGRYQYLHSAEYQNLVQQTGSLAVGIDENFSKYDGAIESSCVDALKTGINSAHLDWGLGWSDPAWEKIRGYLQRIKSVTADMKTKLAVVLFPVSFQLCNKTNSSFPSIKFEQLLSQLKISHLDLLPTLQEFNAQKIYIDHCHFSPYGNKVVADQLAKFLMNQSLVDFAK